MTARQTARERAVAWLLSFNAIAAMPASAQAIHVAKLRRLLAAVVREERKAAAERAYAEARDYVPDKPKVQAALKGRIFAAILRRGRKP